MVSALADLRVCVIDMDGEMRRRVREELAGMGISQVRECADPSMALILLSEFDADFCIVDWMGENMDGLAFVRFIRTHEDSPNPGLPIIMMTENANTQRVIDARNAGVDEFLAKPINGRALHSRLLSLVENPRLFIRSEAYSGPDRRRSNRPFVGEDRRNRGRDVDTPIEAVPPKRTKRPAKKRVAAKRRQEKSPVALC